MGRMKSRVFLLILVLGLIGWLGLFVIQRQFKLGNFAQSPQELTLRPGKQAIVAGGRAVLGFVAPELKKNKGHQIQIRCAAEKSILKVTETAQTKEICGVQVRSLGPVDPLNARYGGTRFEVSWNP